MALGRTIPGENVTWFTTMHSAQHYWALQRVQGSLELPDKHRAGGPVRPVVNPGSNTNIERKRFENSLK
jgi:hypothetical protein